MHVSRLTSWATAAFGWKLKQKNLASPNVKWWLQLNVNRNFVSVFTWTAITDTSCFRLDCLHEAVRLDHRLELNPDFKVLFLGCQFKGAVLSLLLFKWKCWRRCGTRGRVFSVWMKLEAPSDLYAINSGFNCVFKTCIFFAYICASDPSPVYMNGSLQPLHTFHWRVK